jgi:site-specific recombinase XerD
VRPDRETINFLRSQLGGDLSVVPEIVHFWKTVGVHLIPMRAAEGVEAFCNVIPATYKRRTKYDIVERIAKFSAHFKDRSLHEISAGDVEDFLNTISAGGNRWSMRKRLRPFFKYAKRRNWVSTNVMEEIPTPPVQAPSPRRLLGP